MKEAWLQGLDTYHSPPAAAKAVGLVIPDGYRLGLHNFRHSLSTWLVNKGKAEPKTVQSLLLTAALRRLRIFTRKAGR